MVNAMIVRFCTPEETAEHFRFVVKFKITGFYDRKGN